MASRGPLAMPRRPIVVALALLLAGAAAAARAPSPRRLQLAASGGAPSAPAELVTPNVTLRALREDDGDGDGGDSPQGLNASGGRNSSGGSGGVGGSPAVPASAAAADDDGAGRGRRADGGQAAAATGAAAANSTAAADDSAPALLQAAPSSPDALGPEPAYVEVAIRTRVPSLCEFRRLGWDAAVQTALARLVPGSRPGEWQLQAADNDVACQRGDFRVPAANADQRTASSLRQAAAVGPEGAAATGQTSGATQAAPQQRGGGDVGADEGSSGDGSSVQAAAVSPKEKAEKGRKGDKEDKQRKKAEEKRDSDGDGDEDSGDDDDSDGDRRRRSLLGDDGTAGQQQQPAGGDDSSVLLRWRRPSATPSLDAWWLARPADAACGTALCAALLVAGVELDPAQPIRLRPDPSDELTQQRALAQLQRQLPSASAAFPSDADGGAAPRRRAAAIAGGAIGGFLGALGLALLAQRVAPKVRRALARRWHRQADGGAGEAAFEPYSEGAGGAAFYGDVPPAHQAVGSGWKR
ncbi:hypothetical protein Rsub_03883 [Raphidocelis subcapitata]|uniref:Uncharacterized protein n=1 Tax=Raphidocelis subcapitata TaxID=307507 RepID=A0A2V0NTN1_9CHLO|nr:hypothetical protein Rsub_03883 [Raphidocelis subcapitata]|eukprot:GBF91028.1 hypothetical protein Rsub_03883 [Raphidocelis subcapitata]